MTNEELEKAIDYTLTRINGCGDFVQLRDLLMDHLESLLDIQVNRACGNQDKFDTTP